MKPSFANSNSTESRSQEPTNGSNWSNLTRILFLPSQKADGKEEQLLTYTPPSLDRIRNLIMKQLSVKDESWYQIRRYRLHTS